MAQVDLSCYQNPEFERGGSVWKEMLWILCSHLFFQHNLAVWNQLKIWLLRRFGAQLGKGVLIKPNVQIKFPWKLRIGNHVWIGEHVWIDNLDFVHIGDHVCISQGALLLCGNHNYKSATFKLMTQPIHLENGVWIGAKAIVCPGVHCGSHAVLGVSAVAVNNLEKYMIYQGNPAQAIRIRVLNSK